MARRATWGADARVVLARRLARMGVLPMLKLMSAFAAVAVTAAIGGFPFAAAQVGDYSTLPVDPNVLTDSLAYTAAPLDIDPDGQQGVAATYSHRDGRQITTTVLFYPDPDAATASTPAPRRSDEFRHSARRRRFRRDNRLGNVARRGAIGNGVDLHRGQCRDDHQFDGPTADPAPADMVLELGQEQATAITELASGVVPLDDNDGLDHQLS